MTNLCCNVCQHALGEAIYSSQSKQSLTSMCEIYDGATSVFACRHCGHVQSAELHEVETFYDNQYNILTGSEDEDQIYEVRDGVTIFRTAHQVEVLSHKINLTNGTRLLDYGCAKSSTIRALAQKTPGLEFCLFDVSESYLPYWRNFAKPEQWAVYHPRAEWRQSFDVVTSFFALEHIVRPMECLLEIKELLKPGGSFYCIVPNVLTNTADLIVVDHVNHFTRPSLEQLYRSAGLQLLEIDSESHRGAFVITARKPLGESTAPTSGDVIEIDKTLKAISDIARFWSDAQDRVRAFESRFVPECRFAIYGAGFYGAFLLASLQYPERVSCFLDQNPFLQNRQLYGRPILAPSSMPDNIEQLLVGLNPAHARSIIAKVDPLTARRLDAFYL